LGNLTEGYLGYFATEAALNSAHPTGTAGQNATVGSTDTIWAWDTGTVAWVNTDSNSLGDMLKATYDPTSVNGSAFLMDNMSEGSSTKIFTSGERTKLSGIESGADVTDEANVTDALDGASLSSTTVAGTDKVLLQDASTSDALKTATAQSIANLVPSASTTVAGISERATQAEVDAGTDTTRFVTPATLSGLTGKWAKLYQGTAQDYVEIDVGAIGKSLYILAVMNVFTHNGDENTLSLEGSTLGFGTDVATLSAVYSNNSGLVGDLGITAAFFTASSAHRYFRANMSVLTRTDAGNKYTIMAMEI
jgi:hypothetical protein